MWEQASANEGGVGPLGLPALAKVAHVFHVEEGSPEGTQKFDKARVVLLHPQV